MGEWAAFEMVEGPVGPIRGDYQTAMVAYIIALANCDPKKHKPKFEDFLLAWDAKLKPEPKPKQTQEEVRKDAWDIIQALRRPG